MTTECIASKLEFQELEGRRVEAEFNGGQITSDSGGLLLREVESRYGFISGLEQAIKRPWPPALGTGAILASPSSVWRNWWGSGFTDWP